MTTTKLEMAKAVEAHALAHYNESGWDTVVECYTTEEIVAELDQRHYQVVYAQDGYTIEREGWLEPPTTIGQAIEAFTVVAGFFDR